MWVKAFGECDFARFAEAFFVFLLLRDCRNMAKQAPGDLTLLWFLSRHEDLCEL